MYSADINNADENLCTRHWWYQEATIKFNPELSPKYRIYGLNYSIELDLDLDLKDVDFIKMFEWCDENVSYWACTHKSFAFETEVDAFLFKLCGVF